MVKHRERKEKADEEAEASNMQIILEDSSSSATEDLTLGDEDMARSSVFLCYPQSVGENKFLPLLYHHV